MNEWWMWIWINDKWIIDQLWWINELMMNLILNYDMINK